MWNWTLFRILMNHLMDCYISYLTALTVKPSFTLLQLLTCSTTVFPQLLSAEPFWTGNNNNITVTCHQHMQFCWLMIQLSHVWKRESQTICHPLTFALLLALLTLGAKVKKPAPFGYIPSFEGGKPGFWDYGADFYVFPYVSEVFFCQWMNFIKLYKCYVIGHWIF